MDVSFGFLKLSASAFFAPDDAPSRSMMPMVDSLTIAKQQHVDGELVSMADMSARRDEEVV